MELQHLLHLIFFVYLSGPSEESYWVDTALEKVVTQIISSENETFSDDENSRNNVMDEVPKQKSSNCENVRRQVGNWNGSSDLRSSFLYMSPPNT